MIKKKALCIASMASNLDNFNRNNVSILQRLGYDVTLAANFHTSEDTNSQEKINEFVSEMNSENVSTIQIDFSRQIGNIAGQIKSYKQVRQLLSQQFDIVHCHSPICSVITRLCARKYRSINTKTVYTAHGFHFFDGAPLKNWLLFYPVEKWLSRYTDVLITINKEDFHRANTRFKAGTTLYIPGVGVDTKKYSNCAIDVQSKRKELGIDPDDYVIISVGELNNNKNHQEVLRAISRINDDKVKYLIVGKGDLDVQLRDLAKDLGISHRVIITGYRKDIGELLSISNCFAFPSKREGLGLAAIEGLSAGLPVIGHDVGGIRDFVINGKTGWLCKSNQATEYKELIEKTMHYRWDRQTIKATACKFDQNITNQIMTNLYKSM